MKYGRTDTDDAKLSRYLNEVFLFHKHLAIGNDQPQYTGSFVWKLYYAEFIIPGLRINLDSFAHSSNSEIQFMISVLKTPSVAYLQCFKALPVYVYTSILFTVILPEKSNDSSEQIDINEWGMNIHIFDNFTCCLLFVEDSYETTVKRS